ncbi:MAG: glycosyl hydrolase [Acutalibacteraceae bacterium]
MKRMRWRIAALLAAAVMTLTCLSACGSGQTADEPTATGPTEIGTEEELTAVRENLIKATEIKGLGEITKLELYENGVRTASDKYVQVKDNKKLYYSGDIKRVVNYPDGYILDIPQDWKPDYSMSTVRVRYVSDEVTLIATNEEDIYRNFGSATDYIDNIFQYITADSYLRLNRVEKLSEETISLSDGYQAYVLKMHLLECDPSVKSYYTYVVYYNEINRCVQLMFKSVDDRDFAAVYNSFDPIVAKGTAVDTLLYPCEDNPSWNEETSAYYHSLKESDKMTWGLFAGNVDDNNLFRVKIPVIEKAIDFQFPIISSYTEMDWEFPTAGAQQVDKDGRVLQYTYHFSYWQDDVGMGLRAPILDVYRGKRDDSFAKTAQQIAAYGRPTLFRLNNEMNSDWTCWSAVNTMLDPEIFTETWIRMYDIFEAEGANANCIWIWNPQADFSIPKANWNEIRTYMPGARYVDMIGITYYNFGDENTWGTYEYLYSWIDAYYGAYFRDWAWIISEFGCSDTKEPSRKAQWITEMFDCIEQGKYPNIKAAVWFSRNDYENGEITHKLVLDESKEVLNAFKEGLERTQ